MEAKTGGADGPSNIPIIDLFAGPGGLGEGFSQFRAEAGSRAFGIRLSIEANEAAHKTLLLRSFYRKFDNNIPEKYYDYIRGDIDREELFERYKENADAAQKEAWLTTLGETEHSIVRDRIAEALGSDNRDWVLIGGPPCQAYSLAGRSRMMAEHRKKQAGDEKDDAKIALDAKSAFDSDHRHYLYLEYLRIIADHEPAIFVMENVPGLLSSKVKGDSIINKITQDLRKPINALKPSERPKKRRAKALEYRLYGLSGSSNSDLFGDGSTLDLRSLIVRAEEHGVPQARHRVLIIGVRSDLQGRPNPLDPSPHRVSVSDAIADLPELRSAQSRTVDTAESWALQVASVQQQVWFKAIQPDVKARMRDASRRILEALDNDTLFPIYSNDAPKDINGLSDFMKWCRDSEMSFTCNHHSRSHMKSDLWRYLFAASFAQAMGTSPKIMDFPKDLWPNHANAEKAAKKHNAMFADRFRVQLKGNPSKTIVSHISQDGHYYIHYDPAQCRSLTVREAARLQSFPDNYFFEGNRSQQYSQVGNAVPPLLAYRVAKAVYKFLATALPSRS
ncbi:MAG TPA: DNA cytosine methyltransferase [Rhodothermales bacterium]|nr:DNA cytosine methyltransferase [Rhodothermales bacterium]